MTVLFYAVPEAVQKSLNSFRFIAPKLAAVFLVFKANILFES